MSDTSNSESFQCDTFSCKCVKCTHNNNNNDNKTNESTNLNCNKMLNTIVNRMIVKTKMNSIDLLTKLHNLLPDKEKKQFKSTNISNNITNNNKQIVYKPFSKSHKINKSIYKNNQKRKHNTQIHYFDFDFTDKKETNTNNVSNENIIKPLAWETSIRLKRNRKNRNYIRF